MPSLADAGRRLLRTLLGSAQRPVTEAPTPGLAAVLDGATAVAVTEACIAETAALGATAPAIAAERAWERELAEARANLLGAPLGQVSLPSARSTLAAALGLAAGGSRATAFLAGPDLATVQDLLVVAARRHLPLVVHVAARALDGPGAATGSGHEAVFAAADAGWVVLVARNVQEAVDLTLVARRVAETALVPVMVAMDGEETARSVQDVFVPDPALVRALLGAPGDEIPAPTDAQRLLWGDVRRRLPIQADPERPALSGPLHGREVFGTVAALDAAWFLEAVPRLLAGTFGAVATRTGRTLVEIGVSQVDDADTILVALGSAAEVATQAVRQARRVRNLRVGVVSPLVLRPFPGGGLAGVLAGRKAVAVLERTLPSLAGDPPLLREIRACMDRSRENARFGADTHPGYPALGDGPRLVSVPSGLGGLPIRTGDLGALLGLVAEGRGGPLWLGAGLQVEGPPDPKRKAWLDTLARVAPGTLARGVRDPAGPVRPEADFVLAVHRNAGQGGEDLVRRVGVLAREFLGGGVRSRAGEPRDRWAMACRDHVAWRRDGLEDGGDDVLADVAVILHDVARLVPVALGALGAGGALILPDRGASLPPAVAARVAQLGVEVFHFASTEPDDDTLLGTLFGVLFRRNLLSGKARNLLAARDRVLADVEPAHRQVRVGAFQAAFEGVAPRDAQAGPAPVLGVVPPLPLAVRHLTRADQTLDSVPRFWDQVGRPLLEGGNVPPDPHMAHGVVPPMTATFRSLAGHRRSLPVFRPTACTGCGACWRVCPEGAVEPVALRSTALLEAGMAMASAAGQNAEPLRPLVGRLAKGLGQAILDADPRPDTLGPVLEAMGSRLVERLPGGEERRQQVSAALAAVRNALQDLPVALTRPFFHGPEEKEGGTGEILSIAVNPETCRACGACAATCAVGALAFNDQDDASLTRARRLQDLWERLPDTAGSTLQRVKDDPDVGLQAALLLSRACLLGVLGGDGAEPGSGEKLALRHALAAAEYQLQPHLQQYVEEVGRLADRAERLIREMLADTLPIASLDALGQNLRTLGTPTADLSEVLAGVPAAATDRKVDIARLRRLVEAARRLRQLRWRLGQGPDGLGRARFGLVVAPGPAASWAGTFPFNPFHVPVVMGVADESPALARGLVEAWVRRAAEDLAAVRVARAEVEQPEKIDDVRAEASRLTWAGLTPAERRLCPPVLLVGSEASLARGGLGGLADLLAADLPVKVLLLADLGFGLAEGHLPSVDIRSERLVSEVALLGLSRNRAWVAQGSVGRPDALARAWIGAFAHPGPAVVRVAAPSPERHGFAPSRAVSHAALAVESRAFPVFRFDPLAEGAFGLCLDLDGNPAPGADWSVDEKGRPVTVALWAATEARFAGCFLPLDAGAGVPLHEYLALPPHARAGQVPFVDVEAPDGTRRLGIGPGLLAVVEERARTWRTLQELAGISTPFTARVRAELEASFAAARDAEVAAMRAACDARVAQVEDEHDERAVRRVRDSLLALTGLPPVTDPA